MTITLWLLIFAGSGYRPAIVVERFASEAHCMDAVEQIKRITSGPGFGSQFPMCLRVEVPK